MKSRGSLSASYCARVVDNLSQETLLLGKGGKILFANPAAEEFLVDGEQHVFDLFANENNELRGKLRAIAQSGQWLPLNATFRSGPMKGVELKMRGRGVWDKDAAEHNILLVSARDRDEGFAQLRGLVRELNRDLLSKRNDNANLERALEAEGRLHRELIHRVKNNLALLNALVSFRSKASDSADVKKALSDLENRIHAIRAVHDLLDQAGEIDFVQAGELIRSLCHQLQQSVLPDNISLENELLDVTLPVEDATPLSLLINELITNAAKHAFPGNRDGRVRVALQKNGVDKLEVSIADDGKGMSDDSEREGSGSRIMEALAQQIGGELQRKSEGTGTKWTFIFPYRAAHRDEASVEQEAEST
ncbi:sensor histidine kinase [Pseudoblastomonas halimionae]|uniref:histidine kinase n=1 Tax=Alteriqipengyuania halimionae TaxID=1926630 RepID=A0A6I4TZT2_9SPHN|nr:sensor histidine kinase [Alteriqipengyuania halimionae]MXP09319.1 hypothetical protein [Alteriqipengyuania halimionae]